jgi:hypothetical protein
MVVEVSWPPEGAHTVVVVDLGTVVTLVVEVDVAGVTVVVGAATVVEGTNDVDDVVVLDGGLGV